MKRPYDSRGLTIHPQPQFSIKNPFCCRIKPYHNRRFLLWKNTVYVRRTVTWEGRRYEVRGKTEQEALEKLLAAQGDPFLPVFPNAKGRRKNCQ